MWINLKIVNSSSRLGGQRQEKQKLTNPWNTQYGKNNERGRGKFKKSCKPKGIYPKKQKIYSILTQMKRKRWCKQMSQRSQLPKHTKQSDNLPCIKEWSKYSLMHRGNMKKKDSKHDLRWKPCMPFTWIGQRQAHNWNKGQKDKPAKNKTCISKIRKMPRRCIMAISHKYETHTVHNSTYPVIRKIVLLDRP